MITKSAVKKTRGGLQKDLKVIKTKQFYADHRGIHFIEKQGGGDLHDTVTPLGINEFDQAYGGIPQKVINIARTPDSKSSTALLGHFLDHTLKKGGRVALISFNNPKLMLTQFEQYGFYFNSYLKSEQLIYLYYTPHFSRSLSFTTDYKILFKEIVRLCGGAVNRLAFENVDTLFNLQSYFLAKNSAQKVISATGNSSCTILGTTIFSNNKHHRYLYDLCNVLMPSYLEMESVQDRRRDIYSLCCKKTSCCNSSSSVYLQLSDGNGLRRVIERKYDVSERSFSYV